ncbi:hypothetical protein ACFE04_026210 [Oxalis oulophora]
MAFAHYLISAAVPLQTATNQNTRNSILLPSPSSVSDSLLSFALSSPSPSSSLRVKPRRNKLSVFHRLCRTGHKVKANTQESGGTLAADAFPEFKHLLLPITDQNPYLSEGTRQAAATTAALAKKYGADITVVVIDEKSKESIPEHESRMSSIRWHLSEGNNTNEPVGCNSWEIAMTTSNDGVRNYLLNGIDSKRQSWIKLLINKRGFQEFKMLERLGEGSKPTAIIGEVADELNLDLVVMSMEAIHSKHVDANLLAEFIPCPVIFLPL